jgi:hypothetical protein
MTGRSRIDAAELGGARLSPDGSRLTLLLRDAEGRKISLSLPANCLNTVLMAAPPTAEAGTVHPLDTWNMAPSGNGHDMILTLCTPEGTAISFTIKPWQVQGMATVATYGTSREVAPRSVH